MRRCAFVILAVVHGTAAFAENDTIEFFRPSQATSATISPVGDRIAIGGLINNNASVSLVNIGSGDRSRVFDGQAHLGLEESRVVDIQWLDNRHLSITVTENRQAIAELVDTRVSRNVYIVDTAETIGGEPQVIYSIETTGHLINALPEVDGRFLYGRSGIVSHAFQLQIEKLNRLGAKKGKKTLIDGGQLNTANEIASYDGFVLRWFTSTDGAVRSALAISKDKELVLVAYDNNAKTWEELKTWTIVEGDQHAGDKENKSELFIPLAQSSDPYKFYAVLEQDGQTDGLYLYDVTSDQRTLIYRHKSADIYSVILERSTQSIRGVGTYDQGELRYDYLHDKSDSLVARLQDRYPRHNVAIVDNDLAESRFVFSLRSFAEPGQFLLWDAKTEEVTHIATALPGFETNEQTIMVTGVAASHSLDIPYLLTLPDDSGASYPLVLIPHGGPIGLLDDRQYDPLAQFLVAQGFAVLQVNYRGSAGYSDEFVEAGKKEWGGKILDDIMAALDEVGSRPDIDDDRVCIFGGSYGGYAAISLGIKHPDRFRCMGSVAGVMDVNLIVSRRDISADGREWLADFIGDPEQDFEELAAISPAYQAENVRIPLFLAHGQDDHTVDVEHAFRMKLALDNAGKPYEFHVLEDTGHGFQDPSNAAKLYEKVVAFLSENLR